MNASPAIILTSMARRPGVQIRPPIEAPADVGKLELRGTQFLQLIPELLLQRDLGIISGPGGDPRGGPCSGEDETQG